MGFVLLAPPVLYRVYRPDEGEEGCGAGGDCDFDEGSIVEFAPTNYVELNPGSTPEADEEASRIAGYMDLKPGSKFADVGASDGYWITKLLEHAPNAVAYAVEGKANRLSLAALEKRKKMYPDLHISTFDDANRGLPVGTLNAILVRMSFHWDPNPTTAAASYFRALVDGGRVVMMEHPQCQLGDAMDGGYWDPEGRNVTLYNLKKRNPYHTFIRGPASPLGTGHALQFRPVALTFEAVGFELVEHGHYIGFDFEPCSWYGIWRKPQKFK